MPKIAYRDTQFRSVMRRIGATTHYGKDLSVCGIAVGPAAGKWATLNRALVNCGNCLRSMRADEKREAARLAAFDEAPTTCLPRR